MDIFILFDGSVINFRFSVGQVNWPLTLINSGQVKGVWEMFGVGSPTQSCFEDEFNLSITQSNNHPYLSWNTTNYSIQYYEIYKKKGSSQWSQKATTTNNFYEDTSESVDLPNGEKTYVYYKIRAKINSQVKSLYSNEVDIAVQNYPIAEKKLPDFSENVLRKSDLKEYIVKQNYPNPFNSDTKISFFLPKEQIVTLKIYDINGKTIVSLMDNEFLNSGEHSVVFHANEIPSGLYFYELKTDNYRKINRMLFLK